jgi:hypothetical protein
MRLLPFLLLFICGTACSGVELSKCGVYEEFLCWSAGTTEQAESPQREWKHNADAAFSPDGKQLLVGSLGGTAVLREVLSGKVLYTWTHLGKVRKVSFSPDGKKILIFSEETLVLLEVATGKMIWDWKSKDRIFATSFSPDGKQLFISSGDSSSQDVTLVLMETMTKNVLHSWKQSYVVWAVAFSPDGKKLLIGSANKTAVLRDVLTGGEIKVWKHDAGVVDVMFSADGTKMLTRTALPDYIVTLRHVDYGADLQLVLSAEIQKVEEAHRTLPAALALRQQDLEKSKPKKDEFESVAQFDQRVEKWNVAVEKLNADIKSHYSSLKSLPLSMRAKAFERALSTAYGNPELSDVRYDPESARFFATLKASLDPKFKRLISIPVPNDQAKAAKAQLESDKNGLEIELRVTEQNEMIWGQPRVRIDSKVVVAQFVDKDFVSPLTSTITGDSQLKTITLPSLAPLPQVANVKVTEDPGLNKLKMEVLQKELEQAALAARQAEEKRLKDRLAELNRQSQTTFNDDLPGLISKLPAAKANPRLYVLAIGINDYADVPDVPFADRSAQQFAEISQKLLGAQPQNVIVLTDGQATLGRLLSRLNTLLNRLGPQDQLLFYYAGHGVPSKDGAGAYLLAQDGGPGSYEQPDLQLGQIYSVISKSRVGQAKIFIDACFSGRSGKDSIVFEGVAPIVVKPKQTFPDSDRIAVMTAGRGDQFSNQDKGRGHRLFSYHLMRLILEDGVKLEIGQLHQRLRQRVLEESRRIGPEFEQEPDFQGNGRMALLN